MDYRFAIATLGFGATYGYNPDPTLYELVAIEGAHVWGVSPEANHLQILNRTVNDGSMRTFGVRVYKTVEEAQEALKPLLAEHEEKVTIERERKAKHRQALVASNKVS